MSLLIVGSVALDTVKTPFGKHDYILGGSAVHASVAASFFSKVNLVGVVGEDFPVEHVDFLNQKGIDTAGLQIKKGKTFHWEGYYEYDMNQAHTVATDLNVFADFDPVIPKKYQDSEYVFLANIDPELQLKVLKQIKKPKLSVLDTMNFWIETKKEQLLEVIKQVDIVVLNEGETRQLLKTPNLISGAKELLKMGVKKVIIKKGEHGCLLFEDDHYFAAPSFPLDRLVDPTGAGDSFAGGFIGYLAESGDLSHENMRKAVIIGSTIASYNVEDFSLNRMRKLTKKDIQKRFSEFKQMTEFEGEI
ncbi:MAG: PfkB family carbohydrate kinase [Candidatus Margulisiibacteriota bacterium]|jgi:ribokinase